MIDETQLEMELLEIVTFPLPKLAVKFYLQPRFNYSTKHRWILSAVLNFSLKIPCL